MGEDAASRHHPRWIHRHGVLFTAVLRPPAATPADPAAADSDLPALARLSMTFGWSRLPDFVGLGVRVHDWPPPGRADPEDTGDPVGTADSLDLLLASSGAPPDGLRKFGSTRDVLGCAFTSRLPVPLAGALRIVAAVPIEARSSTLAALGDGSGACPVTYRLMTSGDAAPDEWAHLGELTLTAPAVDGPGLALHPPTRGPAPLTGIRRRVYDWAQRHR